MSSVTKYLVYGPQSTLRRMTPKLFESVEPKYLYQYNSPENNDEVYVAVYEQYEKQINATITLTCVIECTAKQNRVELKKAGGRMGFRGSSLCCLPHLINLFSRDQDTGQGREVVPIAG